MNINEIINDIVIVYYQNYPSYDDGAILDSIIFTYEKSTKICFKVLKNIKCGAISTFNYIGGFFENTPSEFDNV